MHGGSSSPGDPPDLHSWQECYNLLTTALVGFGAVGHGPLLDYGRLIAGYANRHGNITWPLLCQTDIRCGLEHMERLRRTLEKEHTIASAKQQSPATSFNPDRPWDSVWTAAVDDHSFWHRQFEEHALLSVTKAGTLNEVVTREAPFTSQPATSSSSLPGVETITKRRKITRPGQPNKVHKELDGVFTHNRRGAQLCPDWQTGNCQVGPGVTCPKNPALIHQCNKCLGDKHGGSRCNGTPRQPSSGKRKGKGKRKRQE